MPFFRFLYDNHSKNSKSTSISTQTPSRLVNDPDLPETESILFYEKNQTNAIESLEFKNSKQITSNEDCFVLENKDYHEKWRPKTGMNKTGLGLHKSVSDISIISNRVKEDVRVCRARSKPCRECFRLQRRCQECNMRVVLRRHLSGKTSQKEFHEFLGKCLSDPSNEYRKVFNSALEVVGRELGLNEKQNAETKLTVLNKNSNKAIQQPWTSLVVQKQNLANLTRSVRLLPQKTDLKLIVPLKNPEHEKITKKASLEIFYIDKNDPVLINIKRGFSISEPKLWLDQIECNSKINQTDLVRSPKSLSLFRLGSSKDEPCEGKPLRRPLTVHHLQPFFYNGVSVLEENFRECLNNDVELEKVSELNENNLVHEDIDCDNCNDDSMFMKIENFEEVDINGRDLVKFDNSSERNMKRKKIKSEMTCQIL